MKDLSHDHAWLYRTSEAFTRRLGVLGANEQAERMLRAFVKRGLELRLDDILYHAQGRDNAIESLTGISSAANDAAVSLRECDVVRCNVLICDVMKCITVQCCVMWCGGV